MSGLRSITKSRLGIAIIVVVASCAILLLALVVMGLTTGHGLRTSTFFRSVTDRAYPKYPVVPVLRCPGFEPGLEENEDTDATTT